MAPTVYHRAATEHSKWSQRVARERPQKTIEVVEHNPRSFTEQEHQVFLETPDTSQMNTS